jgi:acyl-CoA dehydrogenase
VFTPEQTERYLEPIVRGEMHECYAITEPGAGSDVDAIVATARREGDEYVLNGRKWHVTSFNKAHVVFFQGRLVGGEHEGEHALFIVENPTRGMKLVDTPRYSHTFAHHHAILDFEDVRVPVANLVGAEGDGMGFTYAWFRYERLMIAARCCGAAERLIGISREWALERRAFGHAIADYQGIQFMLADSLTELMGARLMTWHAATAWDRKVDPKIVHGKIAMAKLAASEMAGRVADRAVQIFGGRGYMTDNPAERYYRELRVDRIWEGTSEIQRVIISRGLFKRGVERHLA